MADDNETLSERNLADATLYSVSLSLSLGRLRRRRRTSTWCLVSFGSLSPCRAPSAEIEDTSLSPSGRISSSGPGRSRSD